MKIKTNVKAGGVDISPSGKVPPSSNHNETMVSDAD